MSLLDAFRTQLSGDAIDRLTAELGASKAETLSAVTAAVPSVLSLLAGLASRPEGAEKLVATLRSPDLGPGEPGGDDRLGSLLGGGTLVAVVSALAKLVSLHPDQVKTMLAYVGPLVLSVLRSQLETRGMNAQGLMSLFDENRSEIAAALPAGLALPDVGKPVADPAGRGLPRWLVGLAALILVGAVTCYLLRPAGEPTGGVVDVAIPQPSTPAPASVEKKPDPAPDAASLATKLTDVYTTATDQLATVQDASTAAAALPKLKSLGATLDTLRSAWDKLPESARTPITAVSKERLPKLKELVAKTLARPGVAETLKPVLDAIVARLGGMA